MSSPRRAFASAFPSDCWYALARSVDVDNEPLGLRALGLPVVVFRAVDGGAVALEDRCAHRAYPLSLGVVTDAGIRCGLCGFVYAADGQCVAVPTQPHVPFGASVTSYPVQERDGLVWVWLGEPGRARLTRVPELPWLDDEEWAGVGGSTLVAAGYLLLHENFADVTQVPFVAPDIAPSVIAVAPPLDVVVTETTVTLRREFPSAPLPEWQARLLGAGEAEFETLQEGYFLSPAAWVDRWDVTGADGTSARLRFTHLVTPLDEGVSQLHWQVDRDFAVGDAEADELMLEMFGDYYDRVTAAMETAQEVLDLDGPGPEVNVAADVAALKVREIVLAMLAAESPVITARRARVPR
jgi:phenylpropionate dioxygenase-like ring-hydroxylating dioxygenase large terminal subunit